MKSPVSERSTSIALLQKSDRLFSFTRYDRVWNGDYRMQALETKDFLFIPIPKCASSTLMSTFGLTRWPHPQISEVARIEKFTFTVVRNPYSRLLSCWNGWVRKKQNSRLFRLPGISFGMSFPNFIRAVVKLPNHLHDQHFIPASEILRASNVDFICHVETLSKDWEALASHIEVPHLGSNKAVTGVGSEFLKWFDSETLQLVNSKYLDDFVNFGYPVLNRLPS